MEKFAEICRDMAEQKPALTFSELATAAAEGVIAGHKAAGANGALVGAMLSMSVAASQRALQLSEEMLHTLQYRNAPRNRSGGAPQEVTPPQASTSSLLSEKDHIIAADKLDIKRARYAGNKP